MWLDEHAWCLFRGSLCNLINGEWMWESQELDLTRQCHKILPASQAQV